MEGLRFVFRSPLIRSTMLLDFFATFFSSATALLPIFAQDVLRVGATGYGWLYAAPALGAVLMSAMMVPLTNRIVRRGPVLLWAVGGYGAATVVFGVSRWFWLTFLCLAMTGATDTISMIIRNIVRQLETPDRLRGRMIGVNMVFFQGGPQLGELEAGAVANWLGPVVSVDQRRHGLRDRDGLGRRRHAGVTALPRPGVARPFQGRVRGAESPARYSRRLRLPRRERNRDLGIERDLETRHVLERLLRLVGSFRGLQLGGEVGIGRDLVDVDVDQRDAITVHKRARRLDQRAVGFQRDADTRAGEQRLDHLDLLGRRRRDVAVGPGWRSADRPAGG